MASTDSPAFAYQTKSNLLIYKDGWRIGAAAQERSEQSAEKCGVLPSASTHYELFVARQRGALAGRLP